MTSIRRPGRKIAGVYLPSVAALAVALLAGCASSTRFDGVWVNPEAGGRLPVSNVLVVGINGDSTARRIYEDAVVGQLVARGITAQASYRVLPDLGPTPPPGIESAVRNTGATAVLVSRTVRQSTDIRVTPGHSYGPLGFQGMWGGAHSVPPNVYTVEKVSVETRLFDVEKLELLWTGTSTTTPTSSMQGTIDAFASQLITALAEARVIG